MARSFLLAVAAGLLATVSLACSGSGGASGDPRVVTTVYPISFVVDRVAGDRVDAADLVPGGAEPHDVELSPGQVRTLAEADLVFFVGGGFQPAVEDAVEEIEGEAVDVLEAADARDEGGVDPHVWLDPLRLARIAEAVTDRLVTEDPEGAGAYRANLDRLRRELFGLDNELARGLHGCELGEFVTAHRAFGYLAARYDLTEISLSGLDPEAEVSPTRLAEVARMARDLDLSVIFYEELVSPATAETLAAEVGARPEVLSPLESAPEDGDYFTVMRRNLDALEEALACD
jgi:zinc transport system substrate-binding protein